MTTSITSAAQWRQVLSSHTIVVADFYADWCGPCKMIAPTFDSLATKHAKPGRVCFAKVDVDAQGAVAQQYGVRAMPTFLILRSGSVIETIQGANPPALTAAVEKAVKLASGAGATGGGATFSGSGHRLGGSGVGVGRGSAPVARPVGWYVNGWLQALMGFFGLYFWSLFSLDPYKAAENSPFNINNQRQKAQSGSGGTGRTTGRPGFKTMSDLGSS